MRLVNVLELGEQGFQRTISSGGTLEHGVAYAKVFPLFPGGVQQGGVEVADFAVPVLHVVREVEVAAALEPGVLAGNEDEGPLPAAAVMRLGGVGKINDDRVVQHRAIPFGYGFQFLHQVGHELEVELVNLDLELAGAHVLEAPAVSDAVLANVNAKTGKLHAEVGVAYPGRDGEGMSQSANQSGRR